LSLRIGYLERSGKSTSGWTRPELLEACSVKGGGNHEDEEKVHRELASLCTGRDGLPAAGCCSRRRAGVPRLNFRKSNGFQRRGSSRRPSHSDECGYEYDDGCHIGRSRKLLSVLFGVWQTLGRC